MEYRYIKASEITDYALHLAGSEAGVLPITPWRAGSQALNPDVLPGDTLLIVAIDKSDKVAGYIGLLPFRMQDTNSERIFWNTCWWVAPEAGASISLSLFSRFLRETGNKVVFSDMTEKTSEILRRLKGYHLASRSGSVLRFRHAYHRRIMSSWKSHPLLRIVAATGFFRLTDTYLNALIRRKRSRWLEEHPASCQTTSQELLTEDHVNFALQHAGETFSLPSVERFNWWKEHPWLVPPDKAKRRIARRYYFSALAVENDLFVVECTCNDGLAGFAIMSRRDGVLKTQYLYYKEDREEEFYQSLFRYVVTESGAHTLISFQERFVEYVRKISYPVVHQRDAVRYTAVSESLQEMPGADGMLQDGDGDYIFT